MAAIIITVILLAIGFTFGGLAERRHNASLDEREQRLREAVMMTQLKSFPLVDVNGKEPELLTAECVISSDYLKTFFAGIRKIFGGEMRSFQSILERARREVMVQLAEEAQARGFNAICNVRLETAQIGGKQKGVMMAAIQAAATGYDCLDEGLIPALSKAEREAQATGRWQQAEPSSNPYEPPAEYRSES